MAIEKLNPDLREASIRTGSIIQFGSYPQCVAPKVYESNMSLCKDRSKNVYHCSEDDSYYIKEVATPYQALFSPQTYHFASGDIIEANREYFFKIEPIKWLMLYATNEAGMLLSEKVIDSKLYLEPEYVGKARADGYPNTYPNAYHKRVDSAFPNTWEYSTLRAWLNGIHTYRNEESFFNRAFTEEERARIIQMNLKNDSQSSRVQRPHVYSWVQQRSTKDRVYCLSVAEATSPPFSSDPKKTDADIDGECQRRAAEVTDYAIAKGVCPYYIKDKAIGWWWLRSPGDPDEHEVAIYNQSKAPICQKRACDVTEDGHICQRASIVCGSEEDTCDGSANGIRPAINIKLV